MTPWRLGIRHQTGFRYSADVSASYNEARLTPPDTTRQLVLEHLIEVTPATNLRRYRDYWGTWVHAFDLHRRHRELSVSGQSVVETGIVRGGSEESASWADLADDAVTDRWCEYLDPTDYTAFDADVRHVAEQWRGLPTPEDALEAATAWVQAEMTYETGSTTVHTTAAEALRQRRGVCQDFAHLELALLRWIGIPARYTSGYLHPQEDAAIGETIAGESHAWIEAWIGDWVARDPTSGSNVAQRHVVVGHGRDYADVPPLKGIYHGGDAQDLAVTVELTRVA
jgi:transglutaminase-like putative cysteine protease